MSVGGMTLALLLYPRGVVMGKRTSGSRPLTCGEGSAVRRQRSIPRTGDHLATNEKSPRPPAGRTRACKAATLESQGSDELLRL